MHAQEWISVFRLLVIVNAQDAAKTFVTSLEVESQDLNCVPWSWLVKKVMSFAWATNFVFSRSS